MFLCFLPSLWVSRVIPEPNFKHTGLGELMLTFVMKRGSQENLNSNSVPGLGQVTDLLSAAIYLSVK